MSVISRLKVWLGVDTSEFGGKLKKSGKEVDDFGAKFTRLGKYVKGAAIATAVVDVTRRMMEFGLEIDRVTDKVEALTGVRDFGLVGDARAIADVFDQDVNQVITTTNALMTQLGLTSAEAAEMIRNGFAAGLDANGDFLDQLREYAPFFREAGVEAKGMLAILQTAIRDGVYSDKGLDAIKEATLRIREMTPATREALDAIGLSSTEIIRGLNNGTTKIIDVIRQVSGKLNELPATSAVVGQAIADIFGGPGEDAGLRYLQTLKDINTEQEAVMTQAGEVKKELAEAWGALVEETAGWADGLSAMWDNIKLGALSAATGVAKFINALGTGRAEVVDRKAFAEMVQQKQKELALEQKIAAVRNSGRTPIQAAVATPRVGAVESVGGDFAMGEIAGPSLDLSGSLAQVRELNDSMQGVSISAEEMAAITSTAFADMAVGVGEAVGEALVSGDLAGGLAQAVGGAFADMAINVGKTAIATGTAVLGIKKALQSLNPYVAIAAGVALVALGTAVKATLGNIANGGSGGSISSGAGYGSNSLDLRTADSGSDRITQTVNVQVSGEFKLRGNTLVAAVAKENTRKNLTT